MASVRETYSLYIEQAALKPWMGKIDLYDAALLAHVFARLNYRGKQKIVMHRNVPCVWCHFPTVRRENWLLACLGDRALSTFSCAFSFVGVYAEVPRLSLGCRLRFGRNWNGYIRREKSRVSIPVQTSATLRLTRTESRPKGLRRIKTHVNLRRTGNHPRVVV
jgi:hypothetical protein